MKQEIFSDGIVYCSDYREIEIENDSVDLFIIDPPYMTTKEAWDQDEVVDDWLASKMMRAAKDSASLYVWCGIGEKSQSLLRWFPVFERNGWHFKDLITWKKTRGIGMRKGWLYTREECMWFVKDNKKFVWNKDAQYLEGVTRKRDRYGALPGQNGKERRSEFKRITNVWDDISEMSGLGKVAHYTPKPVKLIRRIIRASSPRGGVVADLFLGSGTSAMAARMEGRRFIGVEKDEESFREAVKRINSVGDDG